jgi:hypothetical protein
MTMLRQRWILFGLLLPVLAVAGCSSELPKKTLYPVRGKVMVGGEPARFVKVELTPEVAGVGEAAEGVTDGEGNFELRTYSNEGPDGAAPGHYKAVVLDVTTAGGGDGGGIVVPKGEKPTLLSKERQGQEVTVEIPSGGTDNLEISVP